MQYRQLPKTGEKISALGYGCMRFPTKAGKIDVEKSKAQLLRAIESGVNYLDTAWPYHGFASETFLGKHILSDKELRAKVNIATKLPCYLITKESQMKDIFDKQIKKLGVDVIDYYLLHALDRQYFERMLNFGVIDFMNKLKAEGKIRNMGFSFHGAYEDFEFIVDSYDWDFCQVQYNIVDETFQAGLKGIEYASAKGLGVIIMEPLRGGSLVGNIPKQVQKIYDTAEVKRTPVDWALRWIYNNPNVICVLSGMNEDEHITENIEIATTSLPNGMTQKEREIIASVRDMYNKLLTVKCTGCAYCMPCPAGIDIPYVFKLVNDKTMFNYRMTNVMYMTSVGIQTGGEKPKWTTCCVNCGKCEKVCPQHLEVRQHLKLVKKTLETPTVKFLSFLGRTFFTPKKHVRRVMVESKERTLEQEDIKVDTMQENTMQENAVQENAVQENTMQENVVQENVVQENKE